MLCNSMLLHFFPLALPRSPAYSCTQSDDLSREYLEAIFVSLMYFVGIRNLPGGAYPTRVLPLQDIIRETPNSDHVSAQFLRKVRPVELFLIVILNFSLAYTKQAASEATLFWKHHR